MKEETVLIVAKTRMRGGRCCIGALTDSGNNLRLLEKEGDNPFDGSDYEIGRLFSISYNRKSDVVSPHTEDVFVDRKRFIANCSNLRDYIESRIDYLEGGVEKLFNGLLEFTSNRSAFISKYRGVPDFSTTFWKPDSELILKDTQNRPYYWYEESLQLRIPYISFIKPITEIENNTLLRVSLARWWRQDDADIEERCYLQLSGWYL